MHEIYLGKNDVRIITDKNKYECKRSNGNNEKITIKVYADALTETQAKKEGDFNE